MKFLTAKSKTFFYRAGLFALTAVLVITGSLYQQKVLKVDAAVQVLLVSETAIPFGQVFPGEQLAHTYTVALDTSANAANYETTLAPLPNLLNLCPFLELTNIDNPSEGDTLPSSDLKRPGDIVDHWQVQLKVPGIKGQLAQDHDGGIIIIGGDYGCKITIITQVKPGKIVICKQSIGGTGTFGFVGSLGSFNLTTFGSNNSPDIHSLSYGKDDQDGEDGHSSEGSGCQSKCRTGNDDSDSGQHDSSGHVGSYNQTYGSSNNDDKNKDDEGNTSGGCDSKNNCDSYRSDSQNYGNHSGYSSTINKFGSFNSYGQGNNDEGDKNHSGNCYGDNKVGYSSHSGDDKDGKNGQAGGFGEKTFSNLDPGTYSVTENSQDGWDLTSLVCSDPNHNTTTAAPSATVKLEAGETVICTFVNTKKKQGKIIIEKKTSGGDGTFNFSGDLGSFAIQTSGKYGSKTFSALADGTYKISEIAQNGWKLGSLTCQDPSHNTIINSAAATIKISGGETVTCTFLNKKKAKIIIHKKSGDDNDSCDFSGDLKTFTVPTHGGEGSKTFDNLDSGTYNVSENGKGNWSPYSVVCTNQNGVRLGKNSASINLQDGDIVDCTFSSKKK